MGSKYLYGAAVQGIQEFIFQTSKLTEIVGASELVEQICTTKFWKVAGIEEDDENIILNAAGNIKYIFESKEKCEAFVRVFPKDVMEMAPGITVSQAVVKFEEGELNASLQKLENKLREQRNKISMPFEIGFMGTERARRTGGVAFKPPLEKEDEIVCEATIKKLDKSKSRSRLFEKMAGEIKFADSELLTDIDKLFKDENNTWIAVVHADGNGLGAIIQNLNKSLTAQSDEKVKVAFKRFSQEIENSTKSAAQKAFNEVIEVPKVKKAGQPYPIRPIVLAGDDLTMIIRADLALKFTKEFLKEFEIQTQNSFRFLSNDFNISGFEKGITACAGIAYVKKSYPFHYAVDLAEKLCGDAKNFVKETVGFDGLIPKSALAFFKVQDSFIESDLKAIKKRTLLAKDLSFDYGPYLINEQNGYANVGELEKKLKVVEDTSKRENKEEANGISKLRQWTTEVFKDKKVADFMLDRMKIINTGFYNNMNLDEERKREKSIIYDVVQLNSFKN